MESNASVRKVFALRQGRQIGRQGSEGSDTHSIEAQALSRDLSVSPKTGRGFKVESSPGRVWPRGRFSGEEAKAFYGGVQGPGGSGGVAGTTRRWRSWPAPVRRASQPDHRMEASGAGGDAGGIRPPEVGERQGRRGSRGPVIRAGRQAPGGTGVDEKKSSTAWD